MPVERLKAQIEQVEFNARALKARKSWEQLLPETSNLLEMYVANGRVFYVLWYSNSNGYEVLTPASDSNNAGDTWNSVRRYIEGESQSTRNITAT